MRLDERPVTAADKAEIADRIARVRAAKEAYGGFGVPLEVLDDILPPTECHRTRERRQRRERAGEGVAND